MAFQSVSTIIGLGVTPKENYLQTDDFEFYTATRLEGDTCLVKTVRLFEDGPFTRHSEQGTRRLTREINNLKAAQPLKETIEGIPTLYNSCTLIPPAMAIEPIHGQPLKGAHYLTRDEQNKVEQFILEMHAQGFYGIDLDGFVLVEKGDPTNRVPYLREGWDQIQRLPNEGIKGKIFKRKRVRLTQQDLTGIQTVCRTKSPAIVHCDETTIIGTENLETELITAS